MAKAGNRVKITLRCSECKQRNYNTNKNKKNTPAPSAGSTRFTTKPSNECCYGSEERRVKRNV